MAARLLLFFLLLTSPLWAADDDEDAVVGQSLTWDAVEGAQSYEVVVVDSQGAEILHRSLETPGVELSLKPGTYRYRLQVYNVLDQLEASTPWKDIVVLRAEVPRPRELGPKTIYLEDPVPRFVVRGALLKAGALVTLTRQDRDTSAVGRVTAHPSDEEFTVEFDGYEFTFGDYDLLIQNPGGLKRTLKAALQVRYEKPFDLHLAAGWAPSLPLFDPWYTQTWNQGFAPWGTAARFDVLFLKRSEDQAGLGLDGQLWLQTGGIPSALIQSRYASAGMSALYHLFLTKQIRAGARAGGGLTASWHTFDYEGTPGVSWASLDPYASLEVNASYWFNRWYYVELGMSLMAGFNNGYVSGSWKPLLLAGVAY